MLKIGITGNIGSGKTTVSKVFEVLGIPVFYADTAAKNIMTADPVLVSDIKKLSVMLLILMMATLTVNT